MNDGAPVSEIRLLDASGAADLAQRVHELREHWVQRHPTAPFFTLGAAAYLDGDKAQASNYHAEIARTRSLMAALFSDLYEKLLPMLSEALGGTCAYHPSYGLPGFHIYLAHPLFAHRMGTKHVDRQFEDTGKFGFSEVDLQRQYSMTLALRLPRSGGGLKVWPINGVGLRGVDPALLAEISATKPRAIFHPYTVGHLALHSGSLIHQIAPIPELQADDERLTMQAHTIWADGRWLVYW